MDPKLETLFKQAPSAKFTLVIGCRMVYNMIQAEKERKQMITHLGHEIDSIVNHPGYKKPDPATESRIRDAQHKALAESSNLDAKGRSLVLATAALNELTQIGREKSNGL